MKVVELARARLSSRRVMAFHAVDMGQICLGTPHEIKGLHKNVTLFLYVGQIRPTLCPTGFRKIKKCI